MIASADNDRIRVDNDKSTFYVPHEDYFWIWTVSGREYNKLMDGTSNMNRDVSNIFVEEIFRNETGQFYFRDGEFVDNSLLYPNLELEIGESQIGRKTPYIRGPVIIDTYYFDGTIDDIETIAVEQKTVNGSVCKRCQWNHYNSFINMLMSDIQHKEFI